MKYLSVCSGMEAASVAWHPLGWTPVGFSEIEPFPCAILKHRFPNTQNYGSLTEYQSWPVSTGDVDLLCGGTPCQAFSVAGLRRGLADPRGNLALTFLGLADRIKPRWIVWENVPGVLSSNGGRDFGAFLGALVELGYGFAYRVLDAQHFGVPQRRRRVFVVACLGDWRAPAEVLLESDCLRRDTSSRRKKGQSPASGAEGGVDANGLQRTVGTLCADTHPGAYSGQDAYTGRLIPQSFTASSFAQYAPGVGTVRASGGDLGGGSETLAVSPIPYRKSKRAQSETDDESWVADGKANTLNNFDLGDTRTTHAVVEPIPIQDGREMEKKQNGFGVGQPGDPAYTMDTTGAQAVGQPIAIQGTIIGRSEKAGPQGVGASEGGPMFTLTKTDIHAVAHCADVAPTVTSSGPPYSRTGNERVEAEALVAMPIAFQPGNLMRKAGADPSTDTFPTLTKDSGDQSPHVCHPIGLDEEQNAMIDKFGCLKARMEGGGFEGSVMLPSMAVRRLTPVECERLQGFPDNWSRIPWKGKPEDQCPDGPRYKACGNSMAVPVMAFIGRRIAEVDAKYFPHA